MISLYEDLAAWMPPLYLLGIVQFVANTNAIIGNGVGLVHIYISFGFG